MSVILYFVIYVPLIHCPFIVLGMEGGPVFGKHADFVGILMRPLRLRPGGAEVQVTM